MSSFLKILYKKDRDNLGDETIINIDNILSVDIIHSDDDDESCILFYLKHDILHSLDKKYEVYASEVYNIHKLWDMIIKKLGIDE